MHVCTVPAVNYNGAGILDFVLLGVDHIEEVEDTAWVCGYAIVRPGQEVELVHTPGLLPLYTKMPETRNTQQLISEEMTFIIPVLSLNYHNLALKKRSQFNGTCINQQTSF